MSEPTREKILEALASVSYPGFQRDIVTMGMIRNLAVEGGKVSLHLSTGSASPEAIEAVRKGCADALAKVEGVETLELQADPPRRAAQQPSGGPAASPAMGPAEAQDVPGVKTIIAVASGKGGVGKSTVAVNLAAALQARGRATGLLDADIYGPSIPTMLGLDEQPKAVGDKLQPLERYGLKTVSMGLFIEPDQAVIWRGPMIMKAIRQFFHDVDWGELDHLVVDLPPGTGDAQLTLVQLVRLTGAVIVTTPQEVALADVRKAVSMFQRTECPILGVVENMSYFVCPNCNEAHDIFSRGGGKVEAQRIGVPFLGEVPITPDLRESGDAGKPLVVANPDSPASQAFFSIADKLIETTGNAEDGKGKGGLWPFSRR